MSNEQDLAIMPVMDIALAVDRRNQIVKFTKAIMVENTDFGTIPGTDKPTLYKPGAEKLTTFFGLTKRFTIVERVEDWSGKDYGGEPFFYYLYRCGLYRGELLIAEADGSCNSHETKYRWRKTGRTCPNCGQEAIIKGQDKYGGGWLCYGKKGGCGAKFKDGDTVIEGQTVGRVPNPDVSDQVNTIQKMAQKRALVAATLLAVNASEFFTQDVEDYIDADYTVKDVTPSEPKQAQSQPEPKQTNGHTNGGNGNTQQGSKPFKFDTIASKKFFDTVQKATDNYYRDGYHLLGVIGGKWFNFASEEIWAEKLALATDHARMKHEAAKPVEVENQANQPEMFEQSELDAAFPRTHQYN